jgi:hypothetical protein
MGNLPIAATVGDVVPTFTAIYAQAAGLVTQCIHKIYNAYDKQIHLQPSC